MYFLSLLISLSITLVHWDDPEGWCGEGGGFRMGSTCIPVADSFLCLAKLIQCFRFKNKIKLKRKKLKKKKKC